MLNNSFTNSTLKQQPRHQLVCSTIDDFLTKGSVWNKSQNLEGVHSVYARNVNALTTGNIFIKTPPSAKGIKFDAYRIEKTGTIKHLGSDSSYCYTSETTTSCHYAYYEAVVTSSQ